MCVLISKTKASSSSGHFNERRIHFLGSISLRLLFQWELFKLFTKKNSTSSTSGRPTVKVSLVVLSFFGKEETLSYLQSGIKAIRNSHSYWILRSIEPLLDVYLCRTEQTGGDSAEVNTHVHTHILSTLNKHIFESWSVACQPEISLFFFFFKTNSKWRSDTRAFLV